MLIQALKWQKVNIMQHVVIQDKDIHCPAACLLFKISLFRERNFRRPDMHHKFCYVGMYMNVVKKGVRLHRFVSV